MKLFSHVLKVVFPVALGVSLTLTAVDTRPLRLATTTSTAQTGLLDAILPAFTSNTGISVQVIAVGTGKAITLGRNGDVDVVLVHARSLEDAFVAEGFGTNRRDVMYNDFVIVGPAADPAGIKRAAGAAAAFKAISAKGCTFISRGDQSGTHIKERQLWSNAQVVPAGAWYREAGQGMEEVIRMAGELSGYTLSDRGTWLALKARTGCAGQALLCAGDATLLNPYGVIAVNPAKWPGANYAAAMKLVEWLTGSQGRAAITAFTVGGEQLFFIAK